MRDYWWPTTKKAEPDTPKTLDSWTDVIGQNYGPGDMVAVAVVNNKSPQMVIGRVIRINRVNSKGEVHAQVNSNTLAVRQSCTVTVQPVFDCRNFYRSGTARPVTYQFWENIIRVDPTLAKQRAKELAADLADMLEEL